jgi:para-aminobenzoate synthetase/4-amino-4-deoxychorismate lyase
MTSTITAQCRDEVTLSDVLRAVYPSGSITGAPKHRAMHIIRELEPDARGIYTGAIGWFDPSPEKSMPNFCLSVPIRTAYVKAPCTQGLREGVMGIGAGIVFDSQAQDEYQECQLKGRFLTELPAPFSLFETMYATQEHGVRHWARHQARLKHSARYFSVPLDWPEIERQISNLHNAMQPGTPYRVKLSVNGLGHIAIEHAVLTPITTPVKILLSTTPQRPKTLWSQHKTTLRSDCDLAWQHAQRQGAFDTLLWNERGELTEGGRSNVLVKFKGRWVTPPQSAGVLPGVMRAVLMDDASWGLTEQTIHIDQLQHAEEIAVCNALRGVLVCDTRRGCKSHLL